MAEDRTEPVESPAASKKRRSRKGRWILGLSIAFGFIVIVIIAAFVTAHFTSRSSFCHSCHEMDPYYASWQSSTHSAAECRDCHIPPGALPYIETKLGSLREVYVHYFGKADAPLGVTRKIPNASCYRCHSAPPHDPVLPTVTFSHATHSKQDCITCHVRVVHQGVKSLNPVTYRDPAAMSSCLTCHDGKAAPNTCATCHTPPHEARGDCSGCHSTSGWVGGSGAPSNHPFALTGSHAGLTCTQCHVDRPGAAKIAGMQLAKADPACVSCHKDQHGGLTDCGGCHTPTSFKNVTFQHPFARTGAHAGLACAKCHVSKPGGTTVPGTQFPAADPNCLSCHGDHHKGLTDCARCHTPTAWSAVNFTHPVVGEHGQGTGIECVKCHPNGYASHYCSCHGGKPPTG